MWTSAVLLVLLAVTSHTVASGKVTFNVGNDSPTLTGAKVTFTIDLEFPHSQKVQNNGDVVWAEDCRVNGTKYHESEPVFPTRNSDWEAVFPDGTPIRKDQKPAYVFVWKTWSQYWQVSDGCSSSLTIDTDDIPLGSYTMDIVIYHYRSKERFIPLGYASTEFSITVNDIVAGDMRFVQNRAIAFTITLHDPSQYLSNADVTFNWDFGDKSGALISRELSVTHTYISSGSFKPQVVVQAVIPDKACDPPVDSTTKAPGPPPHKGTTVKAAALASAVPILVSTKATGLTVNMVASDKEEDSTEDEASTVANTQPAQDAPAVAQTPSPVNHANEMPAGNEARAEGVVGIVSSSDGLVAGHLSVRLDPMFQAVKFPAGIANLDSGLTDVDGDTLTLWKEKRNQLGHREGLSSCTPRGEREDGNAGEMGVVLHRMKLTALHPVKREYDTQQSDKAYFPSGTSQSLCCMF
ncbi:Melanocyte protein PMEL [Liparis tanakae]|uniref:Melanocyte protein PMEL n=1 Tax=Liparis tanakae TaxID=230148 RepID=A0A4Z2H1A7_9TELE|nr:Melanocyte protein PMEL [Liparis tanakae]